MRQKIAIDVDDVIADATESVRLVANSYPGINLTPDNYRSVEAEYWGYYTEVLGTLL